MGPTFSGTFFSQKYGKNSAASKQRYGFWEIEKKSFYRVKSISIYSQFFTHFNTVKAVFVNFKKKHHFFWVSALFFPYFWLKCIPEKVGPISVPLILHFSKNETELRKRFFGFTHTFIRKLKKFCTEYTIYKV